jgi:molecular chaperone DnaJ
VPTLDGDEEIEIEPGTQPATIVTLRGKGMPSLRRGARGDQRVMVNVVIPRKLSRDQRNMLERFQGTLTDENLRDPADDGIFARMRRAFR